LKDGLFRNLVIFEGNRGVTVQAPITPTKKKNENKK